MKRINPRIFDLKTEKQVLRELAKAKALFQQTTLLNLLAAKRPGERSEPAQDLNPSPSPPTLPKE